MGNTLARPEVKPISRLLFADWLRAWALLVMIETHVFNAFLSELLRPTAWFGVLSFVNGLVAPSFLFVSGFVFLVAAQKRLGELRAFGKAFRNQVRRGVMIWLIGYAMHLPSYWIPALLSPLPSEMWSRFYRVDVLHCIAATWLFLLLSLIAIRSERLQGAWFAGCTVVLSSLAPLVYSLDLQQVLPTPLAGYFNDRTHSLFPLFPWSGFMIAGALCASVFLSARREGRERQFMTGAAVLGAAMALAGYFLPPLSFLPGGHAASWRADPRTFLLRLGIVLLLLWACWLYGTLRSPRKSVLLDVSRESLFVYVTHLLLIYGTFWGGVSLAGIVGKTRGVLECAAVSTILAAVMIGAARGWGAVKRRPSPPR
jgi:uncharacterized membrane protein